jgi:DNA-binding MarR family transcriptional regulator
VAGVPTTVETAPLAVVEGALASIVRKVNLPRVQERLSAETGVSLDKGAYTVLRCLDDHESPRLSHVAQLLHLDLSTVSRHVKQLERTGLVVRAGDKSDARASVLRATTKGRRALATLAASRRRFIAQVLEGWSDDEIAAFAPQLERLAAAISEIIEGSS